MDHAVHDPPSTALGPRLAADVVATVREARITLDYSPASLSLVDRVIGGIRRENPPVGAVSRALLGFGAYTGEVLVRAAGAEWVDFDPAEQDIFGQPIGIRTSDGRLWNPLGRALRRYENGPDESLRLFYLSVTGRAGV